MKLEIHQDNDAHYRWTLVTDAGDDVASSTEAFASHATAVRAAEDVRDQAAAAPLKVG
ncbi:MAG: YegP family protein [Actinomycetota bacterium]|nr:YegP family protein [Actinomycetota bacterium]